MRALGAALNFIELAPLNKEILMTRILISLSILSLLAACEAPTAPATEAPTAPATEKTPTPTAATERAPEAKPTAEKAPATTALAATSEAPSACGGEAKSKGKDCANPDCVYGDKTKGGPGSDCPHELDEKATAQAPANAADHFGATFALIANQPLSKSLATQAKTAIQVTGTIDKVCKKKGCWMVLKDGESQARVLMKNYGFTVPLDCDGKQAAVEGTLKTRTFTEGQVKHLAEDGGEDPSKVTGTRTEYVITATGIRIQG
jgi:hypothetical protein